jgi:hypothetical protein
MFHVCVQVDENDVSLIWISNNNNMRLMLLLYRQVKGSLPGKIYLGEGKVYEVVLYSYYELAHLREIFLEHSWKGKFTTGAQFVSYQAGQLLTKAEPLQISFVQVHWWIMGAAAATTHRCTKGKSEREKTENHIFHVASWREINPLFSCVLFVSSAYYLVGHAAVVGDGNGGF